MKPFMFTKISTALGAVIGFIAARNDGVLAISETLGFLIPFAVLGALLGLVIDGILKAVKKGQKTNSDQM